MHLESLLKNFGLSEKETVVYKTLLELGPSPVRLIAQKSGVNRGTSYDILKSLMELGLVSYYNKASHQYFSVEDPEKLVLALENKQQQLEQTKKSIETNLPELKALFEREGGKPQVRLYEGLKGIKQILDDVLVTMAASKEKKYYVYSAASVRKDVYQAMPDFSKKRIAKKIQVLTISLGQGGQLVGFDERKWLPAKHDTVQATYEIMYGGKVAHISLDASANPVGIIIQNDSIYETQKQIFNFNWEQLES
jgi:HTH-type transcriptional regulator, sugar sensing transcriptional regulator